MKYHHEGFEIGVDDKGTFHADIGEGVTIERPTLKAVQEEIDAALQARARQQRTKQETPVFVVLTQAQVTGDRFYGDDRGPGFIGVATFRGIHAGNGDALIELPDERGKCRVDGYVFPPEFPERDELIAAVRAEKEARAEFQRLAQRIYEIQQSRGVKTSQGYLYNDVQEAATRGDKIIEELAERIAAIKARR